MTCGTTVISMPLLTVSEAPVINELEVMLTRKPSAEVPAAAVST